MVTTSLAADDEADDANDITDVFWLTQLMMTLTTQSLKLTTPIMMMMMMNIHGLISSSFSS